MLSSLESSKYLLDQIKQGNVILFLGSGFSRGAKHPKGESIPTAKELSDRIVDRFLSDDFKGRPLGSVASIAISESDLFKVQNFIYEIFDGFEPSQEHILLSTFKWKSIYTTNYDLILERAYQQNAKALQNLTPVFRNTKDYQIYKETSSLPYFKLHGSLASINDDEAPLILSPDHYFAHRSKREHLFNKFFQEAWNYTVLFIGFSFSDWDIMSIINEFDTQIPGRSEYYSISPGLLEAEARHWIKKRITPFSLTYEEFINKLNTLIPQHIRYLATVRPQNTHPIQDQYSSVSAEIPPTSSYQSFIEEDIDYLYAGMKSELVDPKEFYKGYFESWDPIIRNFDVRRRIIDTILTEVVLDDYYNDNVDGQWIFLIKGYAGSGKTVLLKRLAWETAVSLDRFCIFYKKNSRIKFENIQELFNFVKKRIYIFIDDAIQNQNDIHYIYRKAKAEKVPITIFTAGRTNLLNNEDNYLRYAIKLEYDLMPLDRIEIEELLVLLERNKCLGYLESKAQQDRIQALEYKQGYELLVTLYEATHGQPYETLLADEYEKIGNAKAQSVYLTVCIFHRLNVGSRAGLISRVHGISTDQFKRDLAFPLEHIVFYRYNPLIQDYLYLTRHPYIAELVVQNILDNQQKRFDEYIRILEYLDVDFENDRIAFAALTNARKLINDFSNHEHVRLIYEKALKNNSRNPRLLQQIALFHIDMGELNKAEERIRQADKESNGKDPQIKHTYSEIAFKRAEYSKIIVEKRHHLRQSIVFAEQNIKMQKESPYPYHTILKAHLSLIELAFDEGDDPTIERAFRDFEKRLSQTKQIFPNQEFILTIEARFNEILHNKPEVVELLKKAHNINPANPFITTRLVRAMEEQGKYAECGPIIERALKNLPGDRDLNQLYAEYLIHTKPEDYTTINHHLSRSYTANDNRHFAQYLHAKTLYLSGELDKAKDKFKQLLSLNIDPEIKRKVYDVISNNQIPIRFTGRPKQMNYNHGWILREKYNDEIYYYDPNARLLNTIGPKDIIQFNIGFTYGGPTAINISKVDNNRNGF